MEDEAWTLFKKDKPRWKPLFDSHSLYGDERFSNHWHITGSRSLNGEEVWCDFGDIHTDLTINHIISSYIEGFGIKIFHGDQIYVEGDNRYFYGEVSDNLASEPEGFGNNGLPQVSISSDGEISFDMNL